MNKVSKKPRKKSVHKPEFLRKRELLHQKVLKLFHEENDLEEIAKKISRSKDSVYYILSKFKSELSSYPFHIYKVGKRNEKIAADYLDGMKISDIASKHKLDRHHIYLILKHLGIFKKHVKIKPEITKNQLKKIRNLQIVEDYLNGIEIDELSVKYSLQAEYIRILLRAKHVQFRKKKYEQLLPNLYGEKKEKRDLKIVEKYKNGTRVVEMAAQFSIKTVTIYKILKDHGIKPYLNPLKRQKT